MRVRPQRVYGKIIQEDICNELVLKRDVMRHFLSYLLKRYGTEIIKITTSEDN
jgi:hypothetical protein